MGSTGKVKRASQLEDALESCVSWMSFTRVDASIFGPRTFEQQLDNARQALEANRQHPHEALEQPLGQLDDHAYQERPLILGRPAAPATLAQALVLALDVNLKLVHLAAHGQLAEAAGGAPPAGEHDRGRRLKGLERRGRVPVVGGGDEQQGGDGNVDNVEGLDLGGDARVDLDPAAAGAVARQLGEVLRRLVVLERVLGARVGGRALDGDAKGRRQRLVDEEVRGRVLVPDEARGLPLRHGDGRGVVGLFQGHAGGGRGREQRDEAVVGRVPARLLLERRDEGLVPVLGVRGPAAAAAAAA
ncbi:hypothetical protein TOPH_06929, partial [Tolypocladium ophioglossoides CBS 100239]